MAQQHSMHLVFSSGSLFCAGECPPAGCYRQLDSDRMVEIEGGEALPPSFDGHVACYRRVNRNWREVAPALAQAA